jgi:hypothetical protein
LAKEDNVNVKQRRILIAVAAVVVVMMLYPPFNITISPGYLEAGGSTYASYYYFLGSPPGNGRVDVALLLAQWIAVGIVAAIAFLLSADKK